MFNPMDKIYNWTTFVFDPIHAFWERDSTERTVAGLLVFVFLGALGVIQMNRMGWIGEPYAHLIPTTHYMAINVAFTLVLVLEVISLIFTIPCSISKAVGKQFEILALILLRGAFKTLVEFPEPITLSGHEDTLYRLLADGGGAVAIFALLGLYTLLQRKLDETIKRGPVLFKFVAAKKLVALCMLVIFAGMGIYNALQTFNGGHRFDFFQSFYTVLIFSDILLVLIAQRFLPEFRAVFRNSGYALATLLIRLALTAPFYYNVLIGIGSALFAVLLTLVYNAFYAKSGKYHRE